MAHINITYNFWASDDPDTWGEIPASVSRDIYFDNFFGQEISLAEFSFYSRSNGAADSNVQISIYLDSVLLYTSGTIAITNTDREKITIEPAITIPRGRSFRINMNRWNCYTATSTYSQVGYLKYTSGIQPVLEMVFDAGTWWFLDTDSYPVTIESAVNSEPFSGFDNPYSILDVWKLDSNNDRYPWTWGWDEPQPTPTGNWFVKLADGSLSPVQWYIKTENGLSPLNLIVHTST